MQSDFLRWQIGDVRVTRVVDATAHDEGTRISEFILPMATPDALAPLAWLRPDYVDPEGRPKLSVHALVLETPTKTIVVDTCHGNGKQRTIEFWSMRSSPFLEDFARAGFDTDTIDVVVCTHLHLDHVGFNTVLRDGVWTPTFANARYLMSRAEWEHWKDAPDEVGPVIADSVRPVIEAGLVDLVEMDHVICDEVRLLPTPGHTPGHVSVAIESQGASATITGDMIHHPCQMARPEWSTVIDSDGEQSERTRRAFLEGHSDSHKLVIGTHFTGSSAGYVVRDGDAYRLSADPAMASGRTE